MFYVETAANVKKQTAPMDMKPAKEILGICRLLVFQGARTILDVRKVSSEMEGKIMAHNYHLSLIFCPQPEGGYTVVCPEITGCFTEGETIEEAEENIREVIAGFLPDEINKGEIDEEMFRLGCCQPGKMFREIKVKVDRHRRGCIPPYSEGRARSGISLPLSKNSDK